MNLWRAPTANEIDEWRNPPIAYQWYGIGLRMTGDDLQFSVHSFDQDNLFRALYPFQLRRDSSITVNLDHRVTGVGDTPVPTLPQYRVMPQRFRWTTCLRAFDGREVAAVELGRSGGACRARP